MEFYRHKKNKEIFIILRKYSHYGKRFIQIKELKSKRIYDVNENQIHHSLIDYKPWFFKRIRLIIKHYFKI